MGVDFQLLPEQLELVEEVAKNEGFVNYDIVEPTAGSAKGENYLSTITLLTLKGSSTGKSLPLVLKTASSDEKLRERFEMIKEAFVREVCIYETVLPAFLEFQKEMDIPNPFKAFAKEYGSCLIYPKEILILENIKTKNYELCNRKFPMSPDHILLVLSEYAKLHAISFAMKELQPERFEKLTGSLLNVFLPDTDEKLNESAPFVDLAFESAYKALEGRHKELQALKRFRETIQNLIKDKWASTSKYNIVVTHGDCWCNNLMFKYDDTESPKKPTSLCVIDWQLSRKGSPAEDLAYFFCCSAAGKDFTRIDEYFKHYHNTLSESLSNFGCDVENIFPYSALEEHWQIYSKYGLYVAILLMRILVCESSEALGLDDFVDDENINSTVFQNTLKNVDLYNERVRDVVTFMTQRKYIY